MDWKNSNTMKFFEMIELLKLWFNQPDQVV